MTLADVKDIVAIVASIGGITGALVALARYLGDRREKEVREWQKVVLYRILRQDELMPLPFTTILEKYRSEAQAFADVNLRKKEISEDALRRVLLELVSSGIAHMETSGSFRLNVVPAKIDPQEQLTRFNAELAAIIGANPHVFTLDEVAKDIAPKVKEPVQIVRNTLKLSVNAGSLEIDAQGRLAFPR